MFGDIGCGGDVDDVDDCGYSDTDVDRDIDGDVYVVDVDVILISI